MSAPELSIEERAEVERFGIHQPEISLAAFTEATVVLGKVVLVVLPQVQRFIEAMDALSLQLERMLPPKVKRLLRKKRKLAAHYQAKLDRVPSWKRVAR